MSITDILLPSPPSTSSRRKFSLKYAMHPNTATPEERSSPFQTSSVLGSRKRVGFSPYTDIHNNTESTTPSIPSSTIRPLLPSRDCQLSSKSILKQNAENDTLPSLDDQVEISRSSSEMLEAVIQQLTFGDTPTCVQAYQSLATIIKVQDDLPEDAILKPQMSVILKHIRKDLTLPNHTSLQPSEINLITQALKILVIMVWSTNLSRHMSEDYRAFVLDHSIQVLAEHVAPKSVIVHHLHLLASQNFRPGLLSSNQRSSRLLDALKGLTDHVKGNGAISERLLVYSKLLDQARPVMRSKSSAWVDELLTGMIHPLNDTRTKAINLGMKACSVFPPTMAISMSVRQALAKEVEEGKTLSSVLSRRLEKMSVAKEEPFHVPQIWAIVLLLVNNESPIDMWCDLKNWLKIIQKCFNCSEVQARQQANMAWNRFVYISKPHTASDFLLNMLARPIVAQLERASSNKVVRSRPVATSSYCNLLYYTFRPAATHKQYTRGWNEFIVKVMRTSFFTNSSANADLAARILMALFWNSTTNTRVWNDNRAHENTLVEPEELPMLDCKWVRANTSHILTIFKLLFDHSAWGPSQPSDEAFASKAWSHFLKAVREAASKEIKPSHDTLQAQQSIVDFLRLIAQDLPVYNTTPDDTDGLTILQRQHIIRIAILEVGPMVMFDMLEKDPRNGIISLLNHVVNYVQVENRRSMNSATILPPQRLMPSVVKRVCCLTSTLLLQSSESGQCSELQATIICELLGGLSCLVRTDLGFASSMAELRVSLEHFLKNPASFLRLNGSGCSPSLLSSCHKTAKEALNTISCLRTINLELVQTIFASGFTSQDEKIAVAAIEVWETSPTRLDTGRGSPSFNAAYQSASATRNRLRDMYTGNGTGTEANNNLPATTLPDLQQPWELPTSDLHDSRYRYAATRRGSRARYDDSQVHFVAIESSPASTVELDSQLLTDRQREVRDRQRTETAIVFADIGSSPRTSTKQMVHSDCEIARRAAALQHRPSTPVLSSKQDTSHLDLLSSPTPKARHFAAHVSSIDVPSSPLSADLEQDVDVVTIEALAHKNVIDLDKVYIASKFVTSAAVMKQSAAGDPLLDEQESEEHKIKPGELIDSPLKLFSGRQSASMKTYSKGDEPTTSGHRDRIDPQPHKYNRTQHKTIVELEEISGKSLSIGRNGPILMDSIYDDKMDTPATHLSNPPIETDSVEDMIASQLSNDLESYMELSSQVPDSQERESPTNKGLQPVHSSAEKKRKRSHRAGSGRSAKRRSTRSSSRVSTTSSFSEELVSAPYEDVDTEIFDCIVVQPQNQVAHAQYTIMSPEPTRIFSSCSPTSSRQPPYKQRLLPQSSHGAETDTIAKGVDVAGSDKEMDVEEMLARSEEPAPNPTDLLGDVTIPSAIEPEKTSAEPLPTSSDDKSFNSQEVITSLPTPAEEIASLFHATSQPSQQGPSPSPDILLSLQTVLSQLENGTVKNIDLRAVDDLCFQIRFQAQILARKENS